MEGIDYETLLGKVYGTRPEAKGIDADMYCQMLDEYQNMITRKMYDTQEERIVEYKRAFMIIREYVQSAITDGARKILLSVSENDLRELEKMALTLTDDFFDRYELHHIIMNANFIFGSYGLNHGVSNQISPAAINNISGNLYKQ